jgi:hypothetical protein
MTSINDEANARVWDGTRRGHYEVWYLTVNHAPTDTGFWIRYTLEAPLDGHGDPYACLWFARFDARRPERGFGIHRRFPISSLTATADPFAVDIASARLTSTGARGELAGDGHAAAWDLRWPAASYVHRHLPDVMYRRGGVGETTVKSPNLAVPMTGTITVDGETFALSDEPGGQTHLWGRKHAFAWAWGRCAGFAERSDAVVETLSVKLRRRNVTLPNLTMLTVRLGEEVLAFNQFRHTAVNRASWETGQYTFSGVNRAARVEGEFTCRPDDLILAPYEDPDGEPSWCANTIIGDARLIISRRNGFGWREDEVLTAAHRAHFETGSRARDPAVEKDHVRVD